ncbi:hypothetical protein BD413DRAFT_608186 [Trametes elegans]|nr:hypothetical protein BD413DRAFT_608186 [Trametes elegans]
MINKHSTVVEAYTVLGLEQGVSLEVVKSTYKQLALKTHPDKNPGDEAATAQFQRLSEAYNVLLKHLDRSSSPLPRHIHSHAHTPSHTHFHPFEEFEYDDDDDEFDDYDDEYDFYDEYGADLDYDDLAFYMFLFEELLRGKANRNASERYHHQHPFHDRPPAESTEQYTNRLRKAREEQERAAERREREEANRKVYLEKQRERERREAEERQRLKAFAKKSEAEVLRKNAEQQARSQQQQLQTLRSNVFAAARRKDFAAVKKGIWEDNVDAAGGELRKGGEVLVQKAPADPKETLLHIAAKNGDVDLVEWLAAHSADPEDRDGEDLTAFHVALRNAHPHVVRHFFEAYPPDDEDYAAIYRAPKGKSNLRLALDTREPEMVWMVLDKHLHSKEDMDEAWVILNTSGYKGKLSPVTNFEELVNLFTTFGHYTPLKAEPKSPSPTEERGQPQTNGRSQRQKNRKQPRKQRPTVTVEASHSGTASPISENPPTPSSTSPSATPGPRPFRGRGNRGKSYQPRSPQQFSQPGPNVDQRTSGSPVSDVPQPPQGGAAPGDSGYRGRGRGRGRGQYYRGRGRGRGRGQAPTANQ